MVKPNKIAIQQLLSFLKDLVLSRGYSSIKNIEVHELNKSGDLEVKVPNNDYILKFAYRKCKNPQKNTRVRVTIIKSEEKEQIPVFELNDPKLIDYLMQLSKRKAYFDKISKIKG